jgi:hypothetical protein
MKIIIRRATTLSIIEPKLFDPSVQNIVMQVQFSVPPLDSQIVLIRVKGALGDEKTTVAPHSGGRSVEYCVPVSRENLPKRIRIGVVSQDTWERMGPEVDLYGMSNLHQVETTRKLLVTVKLFTVYGL